MITLSNFSVNFFPLSLLFISESGVGSFVYTRQNYDIIDYIATDTVDMNQLGIKLKCR